VKVIFRQIGGASILRDEGMAVAEFATRLVKLKARAAGEPYSRDSLMVQSGSELVQTGDSLAADGDEGIDSDEKDAGSLAQTWLRESELIVSEYLKEPRCEKKRRAEQSARLLVPGNFSRGTSLYY
jgi:hypothetical protein